MPYVTSIHVDKKYTFIPQSIHAAEKEKNKSNEKINKFLKTSYQDGLN